MATLTNKVASSALNGEGVQISVATPGSLSAIAIGTEVTTTAGSTKKGTVVSVDKFGTTLIVAPNNPLTGRFDGNTAGIFGVDETITY